jgi:hypothetical protein
VRTPQKERHRLLHDAPIADETSALYASMAKRLLSAALCLGMRTRDLKLVFKSRFSAELDVLVEGSDLMINDKWLDFQASHEEVPCWLSLSATTTELNSDISLCDHVITTLFDQILMELTKDDRVQQDGIVETDGLLRLKLTENLRQMPRMVRTAQGCNSSEIEVTWTNSESDWAANFHGLDVQFRVTLHRQSTCFDKILDLVAPNAQLSFSLRTVNFRISSLVGWTLNFNRHPRE